jgi:hypothetical protein
MKKHLSKKRVVFATIVAVALAIASGVAYAYFTATGAGSGNATVGSPTNIVLTPTFTGTLYPGGTPVSVSILVKNNGAGAQHVGTITASIATDAGHSGCTTAIGGFSMADVTVNKTLTASPSAGDSTTVTGSLVMADTGVNQDLCQGATPKLSLTSN